MRRFSDIFLEEIRDSVPISAIVASRVSWDRKKTRANRGDWWACCPFHGENTPSFHCEDRKGRYHCFGCGASGNHFRFLMDMDGVDFGRAVEAVAGMAGRSLPDARPLTEDEQKKAAEWARKRKAEQAAREERAALSREEAASIATALIEASVIGSSAYLAAKGFPDERAMTINADRVRSIGGNYLVPDGGKKAVIIPARIDGRITSAQLIWESGAKMFVANGEMGGACHRIARGSDTWLCEGFATGLSLRAALKSLNRPSTVLCCFSASNVATVARSIKGRCFIATDNDKPLEQFGWLGTGEHYAKNTGLPYTMPPEVKTDFNDMHMSAGIFAVQKHLATFIRRVR